MIRRGLMLAVLVVANLVSAVAVVQAKHKTRELSHEVQVERVERDRLSTEWSQLRLEESAWANPDRVTQVARRQLDMVEPRQYVVLEGAAP